MSEALGKFLLGFLERVQANKKAQKTSKKQQQKATKDLVTKEKGKIKSQRDYIKNLTTNYSTDDNSPLKQHFIIWDTKLSENLHLLENDPTKYDRTLIGNITEQLNALYKENGEDWAVAGSAPGANSKYQQHIKKTSAKKHTQEKENFNKLTEDEKTEVIKYVENLNKFKQEDVFGDFQKYVTAIREQFKLEDKMVTENPAVAEQLRNMKRELQNYHTAFEWSAFVEGGGPMASLKVFLKEGKGLTPIFQLNEKSLAEFTNLQNQYTALIKSYTGFDVQWMPVPVEFEEHTRADGTIDYMAAKQSTSPSAISFNAKQIKDRNELIEYAAANRVNEELLNLTGMDPKTFHLGINNILNDPELRNNYTESYINTMTNVQTQLSKIVEQFNIDPEKLTYGKTEFLADIPDDPDAYLNLPDEWVDKIPEQELNVIPMGTASGSTIKPSQKLYQPKTK